jgi:glutaredoxin-related protein
VRNHIPKRMSKCLMLRNHNIIAIIFSLIDFKKRLSRRDTDERFHLSTAQDKVKIPPKLHEVSRDRKI